MPTGPDPLLRVTRLYHFTDVINLPGIRERGGIYATARLREMGVRFKPGGNDWSLEQDIRFGMDGRQVTRWNIVSGNATILLGHGTLKLIA